jgi:REP element-mobilizing transposase RayT
MCALYKNRYRIESPRLKGYDYSCNALYFITICTKDFFPYFGEVNSDNILVLKGPGEIARKFWLEIPNHFNCAKLDEYIIMPDHIHGIINIRNTKNITGWSVETPESGVSTNYPSGVVPVETPKLGVSTMSGFNPAKTGNMYWKRNSLGSIINQYKRVCTINIRKTYPGFQWQSRFYDHIIRSDKELLRIREYIWKNPDNYSNKSSNENGLNVRRYLE